MGATTRWVEYDINATTALYNGGNVYKGKRGYYPGGNSVGSTFTLTSSNNILGISDGSITKTITLPTGSGLDGRFLARVIQEKLHSAANDATEPQFAFAQCEFINSSFKLYSGIMGSSSSISPTNVTHDAQTTLGLNLNSPIAGSNTANNGGNTNTLTLSGTYTGARDEVYTIFVGDADTISPLAGLKSGNVTCYPGGVYNETSTVTYTITVDSSAGSKSVMGAGSGQVPTYTWVASAGGDNSTGATDLLFANDWVEIGTKGLKVKFDDYAFDANNANNVFAIVCSGTNTSTSVALNSTPIVYSSKYNDRGSYAASNVTNYFAIGTKGLYGKFTGSSNMWYGDQWKVIARGPQPKNGGDALTTLNFGNITVSDNSPVKCCIFEIISGAVAMNSVRFTLFSDGTFRYHDNADGGSGDTEFHFGTVGVGQPSVGHNEWNTGVSATDISPATLNTSPPSYLYATRKNLYETNVADNGQTIGVVGGDGTTAHPGGLMSDFIFIGLKMGANETGANSSIDYRMYFDYL